jgi:hypothetical protein
MASTRRETRSETDVKESPKSTLSDYHSQKDVGSAVDALADRSPQQPLQEQAQIEYDGLHDLVVVEDVDQEVHEVDRCQSLEVEALRVKCDRILVKYVEGKDGLVQDQVVAVDESRSVDGVVEERVDFVAHAAEDVASHFPSDHQKTQGELCDQAGQHRVPWNLRQYCVSSPQINLFDRHRFSMGF